jgi:hypothetical protein
MIKVTNEPALLSTAVDQGGLCSDLPNDTTSSRAYPNASQPVGLAA